MLMSTHNNKQTLIPYVNEPKLLYSPLIPWSII